MMGLVSGHGQTQLSWTIAREELCKAAFVELLLRAPRRYVVHIKPGYWMLLKAIHRPSCRDRCMHGTTWTRFAPEPPRSSGVYAGPRTEAQPQMPAAVAAWLAAATKPPVSYRADSSLAEHRRHWIAAESLRSDDTDTDDNPLPPPPALARRRLTPPPPSVEPPPPPPPPPKTPPPNRAAAASRPIFVTPSPWLVSTSTVVEALQTGAGMQHQPQAWPQRHLPCQQCHHRRATDGMIEPSHPPSVGDTNVGVAKPWVVKREQHANPQ